MRQILHHKWSRPISVDLAQLTHARGSVYFQKFSALGSNEIETQMAPDTIRDALYQRKSTQEASVTAGFIPSRHNGGTPWLAALDT